MEIYMMRHGTPVDIGTQGVERDEDKFLSDRGVAEVSRAAEGLFSLNCAPDLILSSPLIRARQTAQIVLERVAPGCRIEEKDFLHWNMSPESAVNWMEKNSDKAVMIFGHMPNLALIASSLLAANGLINITLGKAAAICIEFDRQISRGRGCLRWLVPARAWS